MNDSTECQQSDQVTAVMSLALDGLLAHSDRERLSQHLASCPTCSAEWDAMQQVSALFDQSPMVGPPLGFAIRVERRLAEKSRQRRRLLGGVAILTGSLSLVGTTVAAVVMIILGTVAWRWLDSLPSVQQGSTAVSQVASGLGLVGKGASFFLGDLLVHYGPPVVILLGLSLMLLVALWIWLVVKRPGKSHGNGYA
jgi:anti-sigma factor RsiW